MNQAFVQSRILTHAVGNGMTRSILDEDLNVIGTTGENDLSLANGDTLQFVPGPGPMHALQVAAIGENASGEEIRLTWGIRFQNGCNIYPDLVGSSLGWMVVVSCWQFSKACDSAVDLCFP